MGDTTYLQVTVYDCPTRRREAAEVLAGYVNCDTGEVEPGEQYTAEQTSLGSMGRMAGDLIAAAPRCSFIGWEDPAMSGDGPLLGELVAYCPRYGRIDGECTGAGGVVLDARQIGALLDQAGQRGWLDVREVIEVACGIPQEQDMAGVKVPKAQRQAWLAIIDARQDAQARQLARELTGHAEQAKTLGLHVLPAAACRETHGHSPACRIAPPAVAAVRAAAGEAGELLDAIARKAGKRAWEIENGHLPVLLRGWADTAETAWQGRRRP
jgi:hypothetical protein